jgi:hypothetical protein
MQLAEAGDLGYADGDVYAATRNKIIWDVLQTNTTYNGTSYQTGDHAGGLDNTPILWKQVDRFLSPPMTATNDAAKTTEAKGLVFGGPQIRRDLQNLAPATTYMIRYRAYNTEGWSEYSPPGTFVTGPSVPVTASPPVLVTAGTEVIAVTFSLPNLMNSPPQRVLMYYRQVGGSPAPSLLLNETVDFYQQKRMEDAVLALSPDASKPNKQAITCTDGKLVSDVLLCVDSEIGTGAPPSPSPNPAGSGAFYF